MNTDAPSPGASLVPNRGPFGSEDEALREVVRRLAEALNPAEIWLFGSRTAGEHSPDSDFDLLVVTDDEGGSDYDRAYKPLKGLGVGCDVVPVTVADFESERSDPTSLSHRVVNTGRRIYEREARRVLSPAG
jgi:predicted nucleotidyltransferase